MKFKVERTFLVRSEDEIELDPKDFLHCATIEELNEEIDYEIWNRCEHPVVKGLQESEEIGVRYWDMWFNNNDNSFYVEWQKLKGLPEEL